MRFYLPFINLVCFSFCKILRLKSWRTELERSVFNDQCLNILQYERQTRLINGLLDDTGMREYRTGFKRSLFGFMVGLQDESFISRVSDRKQSLDLASFLGHPTALIFIRIILERFRYIYQSLELLFRTSMF